MRPEQEAAFEQFVEGAGTRLLRMAVLLTGDRQHAEDVVQTALERTARHWSRLNGSPEPYARTVVAHLVTDRWRRRAARVREVPVDPSAPDGARAFGAGADGWGPGFHGFEARGSRADGYSGPRPDPDPAPGLALRAALVAALRQLTARQRAVVVLRYFADLTEAETAATLGISVGTVKSTTSRALLRLRRSVHLQDGSAPDGSEDRRTAAGPLAGRAEA